MSNGKMKNRKTSKRKNVENRKHRKKSIELEKVELQISNMRNIEIQKCRTVKISNADSRRFRNQNGDDTDSRVLVDHI